MLPISNLWNDVKDPVMVVMLFKGGPLDGQTRTATPTKVLDKKVSIVLKDKSVYRYDGDNTFVYVGIAPPPAPPPPAPSLKFRILTKIVNWWLS